MVFGYSQGGSFSQHKQALGYDAATTEQMRLKQAAEQKKREQQVRARQELQSKKIKLRIVQDEIGRKTSDSRRLDTSVSKLEHENVHVENHDLKIRELKNKIEALQRELEREVSLKIYADKTASNKNREIEIVQGRKRLDEAELTRLKSEEQRLESEIRELEKVAA